MLNCRTWIVCVAVVILHAASASGAEPAGVGDAQALAARIDHHIAAGCKAANVEPVPVADDAEFLRRVYLDLAGRIPTVAEARAFQREQATDKRRQLVERLLDDRRYVTHFTNVWRALLIPEASASVQARALAPQFESWLRKQLARNAGYDRMVRDLLTVPIRANDNMQAFYGNGQMDDTAPVAFFLAKELKPENLAASTSRLFLGIRLECAQCHNHPFASWKREQFWNLAAFFAGIQRQQRGDFFTPGSERTDKYEIVIPGTERLVQAAFLDGKEPRFKYKVPPRMTLAEWLTARNNPYFARAAVNRLWAYFFGMGLIDPVDEMVGSDHTASHPELLDELAKEFAALKFDLKFLIRAITASRAYQLTSACRGQETPTRREDQPQLFARRALRGLTAEQFFDSVATAIGYQEAAPVNMRNPFAPANSARSAFLTKFANQSDKATEHQTSILQALTLMNGKLVADATSLERSETLAAVTDAPFMDLNERIETLYLATLSRRPNDKELARLVKFVEAEKDRSVALADVFWALLNSGEFMLNH